MIARPRRSSRMNFDRRWPSVRRAGGPSTRRRPGRPRSRQIGQESVQIALPSTPSRPVICGSAHVGSSRRGRRCEIIPPQSIPLIRAGRRIEAATESVQHRQVQRDDRHRDRGNQDDDEERRWNSASSTAKSAINPMRRPIEILGRAHAWRQPFVAMAPGSRLDARIGCRSGTAQRLRRREPPGDLGGDGRR